MGGRIVVQTHAGEVGTKRPLGRLPLPARQRPSGTVTFVRRVASCQCLVRPGAISPRVPVLASFPYRYSVSLINTKATRIDPLLA